MEESDESGADHRLEEESVDANLLELTLPESSAGPDDQSVRAGCLDLADHIIDLALALTVVEKDDADLGVGFQYLERAIVAFGGVEAAPDALELRRREASLQTVLVDEEQPAWNEAVVVGRSVGRQEVAEDGMSLQGRLVLAEEDENRVLVLLAFHVAVKFRLRVCGVRELQLVPVGPAQGANTSIAEGIR